MKPGCYTALVTPFTQDGSQIDQQGLDKLLSFQIESGITGILTVGTTGESPTLTWDEHSALVEITAKQTSGRCLCIAGAGSNNTSETLAATGHAVHQGADAVLLVDPYYNGPSSLEIRREYVGAIAQQYKDIQIIPYVIPGRTGTQLLPEDLARLNKDFPNVSAVKEASANLENMRRTRKCCGPDFTILSGDDNMTFDMMIDSSIGAAGVISVISNLVPRAVCRMVEMLASNDDNSAEQLRSALKPLFGLITVKTHESTEFGEVICRTRNPLAIKTLMAVLGMPAGPCRQPLGKMTRKGLDKVLDIARQVQANNPELLQPAAHFFGVDIDERLNDPKYQEGLYYTEY